MTGPTVGVHDHSVPDERRKEHIPALDGIRGLAFLAVFLYHFGEGRVGTSVAQRALLRFTDSGWAGVDLFFVLSGFLISRILLRTAGQPGYYRRFLLRRSLRIFPAYYAFLIGMFILWRPFARNVPEYGRLLHSQIWYWTYTQNVKIALTGWFGYGDHLWSLAIEEQFYLVWPTAVLLLARRRLFRLTVAFCFLAPVVRVLVWRLLPDRLPVQATVYVSTLTRADALAFGALVAILLTESADRLERLAKGFLIGGGTALAILVTWRHGLFLTDPVVLTLGLSLLGMVAAAGLALTVLAGPRARWPRFLSRAPLRELGSVSYAAYLIHAPIVTGVRALEPWGAARLGRLTIPSSLALSALFTFAAAKLSWHLIEKHFVRLKDRLSSRPPTKLEGAS